MGFKNHLTFNFSHEHSMLNNEILFSRVLQSKVSTSMSLYLCVTLDKSLEAPKTFFSLMQNYSHIYLCIYVYIIHIYICIYMYV
jgi:hypothetical protein